MRNTFVGYVHAETTGGIMFQDHFWHEPDWFPKSQCERRDDIDESSMEVTLIVQEWICEKNGYGEITGCEISARQPFKPK